MRKALYLVACTTTIPFIKSSQLHTKDKSQSSSLKMELTDAALKDFEIQYDVYKKHLKKYDHSDRRKIKPVFKTRTEHLINLKDPSKTFDILIIGGGCSGAGTLLEASTRGLYCALIDKGDFGAETGNRSINILHGGLRDFKNTFKLQRDILTKLKLVSNRLNERNYLINSAGYMNERLDIVIPCTNVLRLFGWYAVLNIYHFISYLRWAFSEYTFKLPRPSLLSKERMKLCFPLLKNEFYGVRFSEAQTFNNRLLIQTLLTATQEDYIPNMKGAVLGNYIEFIDFIKNNHGTCIGARLRDKLDGKEFVVKAKVIVNCTEISSDEIRLKDNPKATPMTLALRGIHLVLPHKYFGEGVLLPKSSKGRNVYIVPYKKRAIVTIDYNEDKVIANLVTPDANIKEIKDKLGKYFEENIYKDHTTMWSDVRSLVLTKPKASLFGIKDKVKRLLNKTVSEPANVLARNYEIEVSDSGLISLMGCKWITYRKSGQDIVETILKEHPELPPSTKSSVTRDMRLIGAYTNKTIDKSEKTVNEFIDLYIKFIQKKYSLDYKVAKNLVKMYGAQAIKVAKIGEKNKLKERLHENYPFIKAQVLYAVKKEMAVSIKDVIDRRLGIQFTTAKEADEIISVIGDMMEGELNWSKNKKQEEIEQAKKDLLIF